MFTIQSIVMAQKLKGTLSFIAKVCSPGALPTQGMLGIPGKCLPAWEVHPTTFLFAG